MEAYPLPLAFLRNASWYSDAYIRAPTVFLSHRRVGPHCVASLACNAYIFQTTACLAAASFYDPCTLPQPVIRRIIDEPFVRD